VISKNELIAIVELSINNLIDAFQKAPYTFYTESDLHSHLFNQIYSRLPPEKWLCATPSGESILIHREYPTKERYSRKSLIEGLENGSRGHFDLVIWNPEKTMERIFRTSSQDFEKEEQTFIAIEFDLKENSANDDSAIHHLRWDLMKLQGLRNEVEKGYILAFGRNWAFERDFLNRAKQFSGMEEKVTILYVSDNKFVQLSKRALSNRA